MKTMTNIFRRALLTAAITGLFAIPAGAATIDVNTTDDAIEDTGFCSLREAVIAANTNTASGATAGECVAGEAAPAVVDEIIIPAGTYTLSIAPINMTLGVGGAPTTYTYGEYTLDWNASQDKFDATVSPDATNGDLDITESVNLVGADMATTIIDGGWIPGDVVDDPDVDPDAGSTPGFGDRVFHIVVDAAVEVDVQISGLTVMGGWTPEVTGLDNPSAVEYYLRLNGGGIAVGTAAGTYDPAATTTGGAPVIVSGIPGPEYTLDMSNTVITQNYAGDGGGFYNGATTTADMVSINGNHGYANGGGIYNDGGLTLTDSTIDGNGAEGGGGIFDTGNGFRTITASTLSNNGAVGGGGYSGRAGITMQMTNSTVSGNYARDMGGGLLTNGILDLLHVTVTNNTATTDAPNAGGGIMTFPSGASVVIMEGVLLNNNFVGDPLNPPLSNLDCGGVGGGTIRSDSHGYNLSQDTSCGLDDTSDYQGVEAMLVALADNGGPTLTHALPSNSTAVNNGPAGAAVDQRGVARDSAPDIGAYEYVFPPTTSGGGSSDSKNIFGCSLGKPSGFDPTLLLVTFASLLYLMRRKYQGVVCKGE